MLSSEVVFFAFAFISEGERAATLLFTFPVLHDVRRKTGYDAVPLTTRQRTAIASAAAAPLHVHSKRLEPSPRHSARSGSRAYSSGLRNFRDVIFRRLGLQDRIWPQLTVFWLVTVLLFAFGSVSDEQPAWPPECSSSPRSSAE